MESPDLFSGLWRRLSFEFLFKSTSRKTTSAHCLLRTRNCFLHIAFSDFSNEKLVDSWSKRYFISCDCFFAIQMFETIDTQKWVFEHFWAWWMPCHAISLMFQEKNLLHLNWQLAIVKERFWFPETGFFCCDSNVECSMSLMSFNWQSKHK